jgi:hypothetical protein
VDMEKDMRRDEELSRGYMNNVREGVVNILGIYYSVARIVESKVFAWLDSSTVILN